MKDFSNEINNIDYKKWAEEHKSELLKSAVEAIEPDRMEMTRANALSLAGAMKNCKFTREDFARIMARSSVDKGTFASQWDSFTGKGKNGTATEGTIFDFALQCGWTWPNPETFTGEENAHEGHTANEDNSQTDAVTIDISDSFTFRCLIDSIGYKQKPMNPGEIRSREKVPTPEPEPISIRDFVDAVASGHTFYPTVYSKEQNGTTDKGKTKYYYRPISQQIFIVDIDNEEIALDAEGKPIKENGKQKKKRIASPLTIESAVNICKKHGLSPFMIYETFSSKLHRNDPTEPYSKFRICFVLDEPLTVQDVGTRGLNTIISYFIGLFGEAADKVTTEPARLIYGTDESDRVTLYHKAIQKQYLINAILAPAVDIVNGTLVHNNAVEIKPIKSNDNSQIPELVTYNADFFNNTDIPEPEPIIDKILFPGLGMLGAPAKMGKTYMVLQLGCCVATGKPFMGFDVLRPGPVLYLDLQGTLARTKKRLRDIGYQTMPHRLELAYKTRTTDSGLIEQLERWISAQTEAPALIIIDMLQQVKGAQRKTEDSYAADNRILEPLHDLAMKHKLSVFCVMHTRKGNKVLPDDDPFNEILGSTGQFGSADCSWMIIGRRTDDRKRFSVICRDNDTGQMDYEATFQDHRWNIAGTVEDCEEQREMVRYNQNPIVFTIRKLAEESPSGWIGTMSDLIHEVATRTKQYPADNPEKMRRLLDDVEYRLHCEDILIDRISPNGGKRGRRYKMYKYHPDQQRIDY